MRIRMYGNLQGVVVLVSNECTKRQTLKCPQCKTDLEMCFIWFCSKCGQAYNVIYMLTPKVLLRNIDNKYFLMNRFNIKERFTIRAVSESKKRLEELMTNMKYAYQSANRKYFEFQIVDVKELKKRLKKERIFSANRVVRV